jgi:hypothetical protein
MRIASELARSEDQQPVQALGADGSDESFSDGVRLRRSHRRVDDPGAPLRSTPSKAPLYLLSRSRISKRNALVRQL